MDYRVVTNCRVCKSNRLIPYLDLGEVPLCNSLLDSQKESAKYPIKVLVCEECFLSQLSIVVNPEILYKNYPYHSSVSKTFQKHCYDLGTKIKKFFNKEWLRTIDIASNDNCLLRQFREVGGFITYGVEPSNSFKQDIFDENSIPVVKKFWSSTCLDHTDAENTFDCITALNVFAHVDDLDDMLLGVYKYLTDDGIFVVEVPYLPNLIRNNEFDTIYHEHLSYFLLYPLKQLFAKHKLPIFKVERLDIHGGSIRIYASKKHYEEDGSIAEILQLENFNGFYGYKAYLDFAQRVNELMDKFRTTLELLYHSDKRVMGYGASAKGISLLNYSGITQKMMLEIVDDTPQKQGKWTPGSQIPIVDFSHFDKEKPDYIVLLAWNFAEELREKAHCHKGKFIIPIPDMEIV